MQLFPEGRVMYVIDASTDLSPTALLPPSLWRPSTDRGGRDSDGLENDLKCSSVASIIISSFTMASEEHLLNV